MLTPFVRFCLVLVCCATAALAQKPLDVPPVSTPPPAPTTGPISFNVVVTDKSGHPIAGLKQEDFSLLDNKQPAVIRSFEAHSIGDKQNSPQAMFILIDDVNANFSVVSVVRTQLEGYLRSNGGKLAIPVGIFMLVDNGIQQVAPISSDGNALATVLHQKEGQLHDIPRSAGFYGAEERTELSLRALSSLGNYLGKVGGRKLVVWIGPGWPIFDNPNVMIGPQQQRNLFSAVVGLSSLLRQSGITVDSVDPLGPNDAASARNFLWESFTKPVTKPTRSNPGNLALQVFAVHSGGQVLYGSNDVSGEVVKCAADASAWYTLTFDPQRADAPNAWHDVDVKVDKPDLKIRTNNGYYAQP
ncbi:MAG TPA: VWA domain-containing protein [Acidobacteriaceae bacterium]|jgi:VWFA-related protein|nr:VWA domain-containing protein [Acidobacteriaceae bacterium]